MTRFALRAAAVAALLVAAACGDDAAGPMVSSASTSAAAANRTYNQVERLANPLVSEVMVVKSRHQLYNYGQPIEDVATWTDDLTGFVTGVAGRAPAYASAIAGALLPDMLITYPKRDGTPVFWLSWVFNGYGGRSLSDDVVDIGLGAIFGNLLGNNTGVTPGLTTDNVSANDVAFGTTFPYLTPLNYLTSNSFVPTLAPLSSTSTLYFPSGQPSGFMTWNSVRAGPVGEIDCVDSSTTWPSWNVQRAASVPDPEPDVATDT